MSSPLQNLVGRTFNQLTVLEHGGYRQFSNSRESTWKCRCACGAELTVPQRYLVTDGTKSCGCIVGKHKRTHGASDTPEFRTWSAMLSRCTSASSKSFKDYGGRGIKVCERWQSFENFLADMGSRPSPAHSIDRKDNDGDYEPNNCRWTTDVEQSNNRRSSRRVTFNGETLTLAEWERRVGLKPGVLFRRLAAEWPLAKALVAGDGRRKTRTGAVTHGEPTH